MKRKRLVMGKDWHGWVLKLMPEGELCYPEATSEKPPNYSGMGPDKYVRVKFVEVAKGRKQTRKVVRRRR